MRSAQNSDLTSRNSDANQRFSASRGNIIITGIDSHAASIDFTMSMR
jgi:hypothetical protein